MKVLIRIALLIILLSTISYGEEKLKHKEPKSTSGVEALSQDLRNLLSQEMQALENGMMSIIPAFNSGKWADIETTGGKIKNSYILKQNLTEKQVKELHLVLPHAFIDYLAGMLEHAAKNRKPELINFYFSEMKESCFSCHAVFATHKFPALTPKEKGEHAH